MSTELKGSPAEAPSLELVLKRNPVERLKREKGPLGMLDELPALIAAGLRRRRGGGRRAAQVVGALPRQAEGRDVHAAGQARRRAADRAAAPRDRATRRSTSARARRSSRRVRTSSCTTSGSTRCRGCSSELHAAGLTSLGGCGDTVRAITGCPAVGIADGRAVRRDAGARRGAPVLHREPGLRRSAAQAQDLDLGLRVALQRAGDQLHLARRRPARRRARLLRCSSAAGCRPFRGSPATSACSSGRTRRSRCSARSSTPGATTSAGACRASSRG